MTTMPEKCVLIAAGGTGGHVIPAIEVATALRSRGWECVFVGTECGFENRLVPPAGFSLHHVPIGSLNRVSLSRKLHTLATAPRAMAAMLSLASNRRPAAALSLGGYASGPLVAACALLDIPLVVMEPNATPGLANRLAAPTARRALLGHPDAAGFFLHGTSAVTGLPVRGQFFQARRPNPDQPFTILILGGSQGAARLNSAAVDAARAWYEAGVEAPRLIHQTGPRELDAVSAAYAAIGCEAETAAFFEDMPTRFAQADLVVCRAGASVIAELCAARKPSVLVPFPYAADDHQRANAVVLASAGGAVVVDDAEWTGGRMVQVVSSLAEDGSRLEAMARSLGPLAHDRAAEDAADAVVRAAEMAGGIQ